MNEKSTVSQDSRSQPSDYASISNENTRRYGTDIDRIGRVLLADRYDDRSHFVYELLQNAEDALGRRNGWDGSRTVSFTLTECALNVRHYGDPFNKDDVRGICGIAEGKKEDESIGRFGIGFKSVYAFTDRPEIHSGAEDFAIERYVHPYPVPPIDKEPEETVIHIPFRDSTGFQDIAAGLVRLDTRTLLFLHHIEQIQWESADGQSSVYFRKTKNESENVRHVTIYERQKAQEKVIEDWFVFSQQISDSQSSGVIEIAFQLAKKVDGNGIAIETVSPSSLVVYFPTVKETHLGFLVQGPYRTTPSRDNVYIENAWNQCCVTETARLLVSSLNRLKDAGLLNVSVLQALPLNSAHFGEQSMFAELFQETKNSLIEQPLIPRFGGGHIAAKYAKIARSEELRKLFDESTLAELYGIDGSSFGWVSAEISRDRTHELWEYLQEELGVEEVTPYKVLSLVDTAFLEVRPDEWICRFYEFLNQQQALLDNSKRLPLVRLEDGKHVRAFFNGEPQAYLQGSIETSFPTVKASVCCTDESRAFLQALGMTEPSPVDDVVRYVLPKYNLDEIEKGDTEYESDIRRILNGFSKGTSRQRETLIASLRETRFIKVRNSLDNSKSYQKPVDVYFDADRLKCLFRGVTQGFFIDDGFQCLKGLKVHEMLEACGAVYYIRPISSNVLLPWEERKKLRERNGQSMGGRYESIEDWKLHCLNDLLEAQQNFAVDERRERSKLIWEEISYLAECRREVFTGQYSWTYYGNYSQPFDSTFLKSLNTREWIPDTKGDLQRPELTDFDTLDWKPNPFVLEKIRFRPSVIDQFAKETGIDPGLVDLLKKLGITSKEELEARLKLENENDLNDESASEDDEENVINEELSGAARQTTASTPAPLGKSMIPGNRRENASLSKGQGQRRSTSTQGTSGGRTFISYIAVHANDNEPDPDGLDLSSRMVIENQAINIILERETDWKRTPAFNPGYDLYKVGSDNKPSVLCEVKAMTQSLAERPVGLTHTQFEFARKYGENYWLYVVENTSGETPCIVRINDPVGKARTYTFDRGWKDLAQ
ncbi:MAG: DUF3883 domain-containing protein [Gemmatimonadota bacterium]|nr:DUF3883 domain-containing protein [Gemmatimonadota bacterium]